MPLREDEMIVVRVLGIVKALRQRNHEVIGLVRDLNKGIAQAATAAWNLAGKRLQQPGCNLKQGGLAATLMGPHRL